MKTEIKGCFFEIEDQDAKTVFFKLSKFHFGA